MTTINNIYGVDMATVNKIYADDSVDLPAGEGGQTATWLSGYTYRKAITISGATVSGVETDFPVLVRIASDNDLRTTGNSGHVQNGSGYDIAFADAYGNEYYYDRLVYAAATGQWYGYVQVPTLTSGTDTTFYLYYGNSSISTDQANRRTWDEYYQAVYHCINTPGFALHAGCPDATVRRAHGEAFSGSTDYLPARQTGKIYYSHYYDISNRDKINIPDQMLAGLDETGGTIELWMKPDSSAVNQRVVTCDNESRAGAFIAQQNLDMMIFYSAGTTIGFRVAIAVVSYNGSYSTGSWYHVVATYDGTNRKVYVNGVDTGATTGGPGANAEYSGLGWGHGVTDYTYGGNIEEVRISNTVRSAEYARLCYENQNAPTDFYVIGDEEESS